MCACVHVCACAQSVKSLRKLHFAFRTNDDDVEWKTCHPASREKCVFAFQKPWEGEEGRRRGRLPLVFYEHQIALEEINTPNESKADYSKHSQRPCVHLK